MAKQVKSWDALRVFVAVYRAGSFSAGADELGLAQSSVSEQIAGLERSLGYQLLERSTAGVRPTERGIELASRIAGPVDALAAAVSQDQSSGSGERIVFVGGPAEFLSEVVLPGTLARLTPGVRIVAKFGLASDLIDELRKGTIDVLVSALPIRAPDVSSAPIYDEEFALVAHPRWAVATATDLNAIPVLSYGPELPIIRRYWRSVFDQRPDTLRAAVIAPDLRALLRLALDGAGMTVLPDYLARPHLATGALIKLHSPQIAPLNTLFVATRKGIAVPDPAIEAVRTAVAAAAHDVSK